MLKGILPTHYIDSLKSVLTNAKLQKNCKTIGPVICKILADLHRQTIY